MSRAVLFDLDNTLHDRDAGVRDFLAAQHVRRNLASLDVSLADWTEAFVRLEERGRVWKDSVYRALCEQFSLSIPPEVLLAEYEAEFASFVRPVDGLRETLEDLRRRGWKIGLVSNGRGTFQRRTLAALGIEPLLDVVVISEECGFRKPQPEIYHLALEALGCAAAESWFVGDDWVADVEGPRAIGMQALHLPPGPPLSRAALGI